MSKGRYRVRQSIERTVWLLAGGLLFLSFGYTQMMGSDMWWHVAAGRELFQHPVPLLHLPYLAEAGDVQEAFNNAIECGGHALASSVEINAPDGPPENGVVMFNQCSYADGKNWEDAMKAHKANSVALREMGGKGSSWMFFPMLGGNSDGFDYWAVAGFQNWSDFGTSYDMYVNGGGWQKSMKIMQGNVECGEDPTVWDAWLVRKSNRDS